MFNRALPLLGCFLIFLISPLFHMTEIEEGWIIPKMLVLGLGALFLWLGRSRMAFLKRPAIAKTQLDKVILAFWIALLISTIGSIDIPISLMGQYRGPFHGLLAMTIYTLIYYGVASNDSLKLSDLVNILLIASVAVCAMALRQVGTIQNDGRVWGTFGAPIFLGSFLALVMPLAWGEARMNNRLGLLSLVLCTIAVIAAKARGATIASFIGILVYEILSGNRKQAIVIAFTALGLAALLHPYRSASDPYRFVAWKAAITGWRHHPILGSGPDTFALIYRHYVSDYANVIISGDSSINMSAHNDLLQVLSTMGLIGLATYLLFVYGLFWAIAEASNIFFHRRAILAAVVSVFVVAKFNPVHISVLAICAALVAPVMTLGYRTSRWPSHIATLSASIVFLIARMEVSAEYYVSYGNKLNTQKEYLGASNMFHAASMTNPLEMYYVERELNQLWKVAPIVDHGNMKRVAAASIVTADTAVRIHPNDPVAHDLRALALKALSAGFHDDNIKESQAEMNKAIELAPNFKMYTQDAMEIALEMGDMNEAEKRRAQLEHLKKLEGTKT